MNTDDKTHHSYSCAKCAALVDIALTNCKQCGVALTPDTVIKIEIKNGEAIIQMIDEDEL